MYPKATKKHIYLQSSSKHTTLIDLINDSESKMRLGLKEIEERVCKDSKERKMNAPLTIEEKIFSTI